MLTLAAALLAATPAQPPPPPRRMTIIQSLTIRLRALRGTPSTDGWREKSGPSCIAAGALAGVAVTAPDAVDFILKGGERMRARLNDDCPALDYYRGFYVTPSADGKVCADRDAIRTRMGGECAIDRFRRLVPSKPAKP